MPDQRRRPSPCARPRARPSASSSCPLMTAFGEVWAEGELENETELVEMDRIVGAFEGDLAVGVSGAFSFRMTTPGGEVGAAGITLVGVLPTHRRRGILRQMMTDLFRQTPARGEPVAIRWASEGAIYQRFGYGLATKGANFEAPKDKTGSRPPIEPAGRGAPPRPRRVGRAGGGRLRGAPAVAHRLDQPVRDELAAPPRTTRRSCSRTWPQGPRGVRGRRSAARLCDPPPQGRLGEDGPAAAVPVLELIGLDPAAEQALWQWLFCWIWSRP